MSESIVFRGTHIRYFDGRQEEGGAFVRIHLTAEFSEPVMEAMDWEEPGSSVTDAKLDGELHGTHLILTPGDKLLSRSEIQFDIRSAEDFKVVTVTEGDSKRRELRFIVRSSADGVAALVDQYIRVVGTHQGVLKISYVKQEQLPLQDAKPAEKPRKASTGCKFCDAGIPVAGESENHVNGERCTAFEDPAHGLTGRATAQSSPSNQKEKREVPDSVPSTPIEKCAVEHTPTTEQPDEHGAYLCDPTFSVECKAGKITAAIDALMIGPDEWITRMLISSPTGGQGGPLSQSGPYFPALDSAVAYTAWKGEKTARGFINQSKGAAAKSWLEVANWFHAQWAERYMECGFVSAENLGDAFEEHGVDTWTREEVAQ
jgi:hypothetical protein